MVKIIWHGHSCFEIKGENITLIFDPHDGASLGIKKPQAQGDIILVSHDHFDHNAVSIVKKADSIVIDKVVDDVIKGVKIETRQDFHDESLGRKRGTIRIYKVEIDGCKIVHLGDLGRIPEQATLEWMKHVDILLIPVGGTFTIDGKQAATIVDAVRPKITIPMHYKIPGLNLPIAGVDEFLSTVKKYVEEIEHISSNTYELKESPPQEKVIVLQPPR